jgi:hypothetical protein
MIRKLLHIAIMVTLILATAGVSVTKHYCGNRLVSVNLLTQPKSCCGDDCNCCHNEFFSSKVTDTFTSSEHQQLPAVHSIAMDWLVSPSVLAFSIGAKPYIADCVLAPLLPPLIPDNPSALLQVFLC